MSATNNDAERSAFITVGTTRFDALVETVSTLEFLNAVHRNGFTRLTIQHGRSPIPLIPPGSPIRVITYDFKPDLNADYQSAALVISHAGAGSILEGLALGKPLLVVVNRGLMDNHQLELATAMARQGVLIWTDVENLTTSIDKGGWENLHRLEESDPTIFIDILKEEAGFPLKR
ncbi:N-acetylglucosaminyldiphosphodolichol N-acetylglucosaminyltransferase catalytic subunit ALG13 [Spizellomyces punctatus DAOM BR117]|uniref:UDP-N-acetylglucosamine transferase subunit ALG13 n=1 Tax=Spizellomyces punctatus (strain DAOM BR117) TaxID=645134 RepID=A0A0L0HQC7_SPIPD|nr:N-acetylglucosaminyldiphosphodolichol N-acetylglucosaminyltransferase catalytic subunit ALG13 [Spizellomyces punctatus DAOM BR117]KND03155.1 hypothetical protein SPPG_02217 [Spizellomyces punctatus DAOM BR117]|eukprot:XP_016611194.1 hypothetical protein SPPG_02217 [Spizellomyces punctatus DAOM BR117]